MGKKKPIAKFEDTAQYRQTEKGKSKNIFIMRGSFYFVGK